MKRLFAILLMFPTLIFAQVEEKERDSIGEHYIIIEGDSIPRTAIDLDEVMLLHKLEFDSREDRRTYLILKRKTIKVYPYAKLAAERLETLNKRLEKMESKRQRKKYAKRIQKYIEGEFSDELKKLTRTEGQILIKLIHRQTGKTTFELIKELRNGWRAFWFNNTAKMFKISLKKEFDPMYVKEDYLIEDILQRNFQSGRLETQKSALGLDFFELTEKWLGESEKTASNETSNRN
ncbi:MAG: DUF4294 domain-containing protein [Bacteroidia bacterium]|nr:DUF4294 domain-containing protein [Bacteroidia bacterium]NNF83350.1 DUF4294 domain-containing protein [Flavobacteriaceae bacterium]MBT8268394.1 DUF4294 domain-containing protein [Bacteroidia bacterium]MBT8289017.1 DUF4294 domain-containing protein [Bacteroidia bacterium]NNK68832.1 DUF4294 domain-containing protein [Flavobacteriaceae bacterium]